MKLLELFSGTGSVGKVARDLGYSIVSLDLKNANINADVLRWDYKEFAVNDSDVIWASPPCTEYSRAKTTGVRKSEFANSIVLKTLEMIDYFRPKYWIIENPQTGLLKEQPFMSGLNYYDVDYCKYGMNYRKRTRLWTNITTWKPKALCKRDCGKIRNGRHLQTAQRLPPKTMAEWGDKPIIHKQEDLYKIPSELISEIFVRLIDEPASPAISIIRAMSHNEAPDRVVNPRGLDFQYLRWFPEVGFSFPQLGF